MPNCKPSTVIDKDAKKCPDCGAKIRMINTILGTWIPVDDKYIPVWFAISNGHNGNSYESKSAFRAHRDTCVAKDKYRNTRKKL